MLTKKVLNEQEIKIFKLKRMRIIATGLLIVMAIIYLIFKRIESQNMLFSFIAAFAEAAMIGALADWFAVVALFRHPLGMRWLPHTAIIQNNRDKIGESLASFVVSNFFTENVIKGKLSNINFTKDILTYFKRNKEVLSEKILINVPVVMGIFLNKGKVSETIELEFKGALKKLELYPLIDSLLPVFIASQLHVSMIYKLLESIQQWTKIHKVKTIKIIEGMNSKFAFPFVGDMIYNFILKTLTKLTEDMENDVSTEFNQEILRNIPEKWIKEFRSSKQMKEKVENFKNEIFNSELFNDFIDDKISKLKTKLISYDYRSNEEITIKLSEIFDLLVEDLLLDDEIRKSMDNFIRDSIGNVIFTYRQEIAALISDTVKEWPIEDMVNKLETEVGGDLQYIRINGTIIGGIVGLLIHSVALFLK